MRTNYQKKTSKEFLEIVFVHVNQERNLRNVAVKATRNDF